MERYPAHWGTCAAPPGTRAFAEWVTRCAELDEASTEYRADAPAARASVRESVQRKPARASAMQAELDRLAHVWDDDDDD